MVSSKVYNYNRYGQNLAQSKKRRFFMRMLIALAVVLFSLASVGYLLFFSPYFQITDINISGLKSVDSEEMFRLINSMKDESVLISWLKPRNNIVFFDIKLLRDKILAAYPEIKEVKISKEYFHKLAINIEERIPAGIWCNSAECKYFDEFGILWGKALRSSGSIIMGIDDFRESSLNKTVIEASLLGSIRESLSLLENLGVKARRAEISEGEIGDYAIQTLSGVKILMNTETDLAGQIDILRILLEEKGQDFKPQYIDLRIDGRIYYK